MKWSNTVLILALLTSFGCKQADNVVEVKTEYTDAEKAIAQTMVTMDDKDVETFYKHSVGLVEYLKNTDVVLTTGALNQKVAVGHLKDYKYQGSVVEFTNTVKAHLDATITDESKVIVNEVKDADKEIAESTIIEAYTTLANAAKCAIESKKNAEQH
jgi:hypothetical protein